MPDKSNRTADLAVIAAEDAVAANLAAAIIAATGRPHSVREAIGVFKDCKYALYPRPGGGSYEEWVASGQIDIVHE